MDDVFSSNNRGTVPGGWYAVARHGKNKNPQFGITSPLEAMRDQEGFYSIEQIPNTS
ncbi:hypothetical protein CHS0354_009455 [Potamilus streckersoni]|uniref:Uncharacterized protein n=1 Tax=Potamilus streckersoni TaxID=2493646 RepID=A0AAE0TJ47_9BIVA|nr:hypothetical protein CHS0354_009455 [Potamilus streckersoni]